MPATDGGKHGPASSAAARQSSTSRVVPAIPHSLRPKARSQRQQASTEAATGPEQVQEKSGSLENVVGAKKSSVDQDELVNGNTEVTPVQKPATTVANGSLTPKTATANGIHVEETQAHPTVKDSSPGSPDSEGRLGAHNTLSGDANNADHQLAVEKAPNTEAPTSQTLSMDPPPLPPAFVPSAHVSQYSGSISNATSRDPYGRPAATNQRGQIFGNMVFGGNRDSAASSPAPPLQHSMNQNGPMMMYPVSHAGPQGYTPHSHGYHISEPFAGPMYPSYNAYSAYAQPANQHGYVAENVNPSPARQSRDYRQHNQARQYQSRRPEDVNFIPRYFHQSSPMPSHFPTYDNAPFTPSRSTEPNGHHGKMDRSPFGPNANKPQAGAHLEPTISYRPLNSLRPTPAHIRRAIDLNAIKAGREEADALVQYIRALYNDRRLVDTVLNIFPPSGTRPIVVQCHALVVCRSPKIQSLMDMQYGTAGQPSLKSLDILITDRFMLHELAINKAISYLYTDSLPDEQTLQSLDTYTGLEKHIPQHRMAFALAFSATGHYLQLEELVSCGLQLATGLLDWATIELALAFALEGGISSSWLQQSDTSTSEDRESSSSVEDTPSKLDSPTSTPTYGFYSDRLLTNTLQYMAESIPKAFAFSATAPQLSDLPRLPPAAENVQSRSQSRLNGIRFGDMTVDDDKTPDTTILLISSILISMPFPALKHLLENGTLGNRLTWTRVADLTREVVKEREIRRRRVAEFKKTVQSVSAAEERLWHNSRWMEVLEISQQHVSGLRMGRRRLGGETSPVTARS